MCVCVSGNRPPPPPRGLQFRVDMQGGISFCILHVCRRSHKRNEMEVRYHLRAFHLRSTLSLSSIEHDVLNACCFSHILHIFLFVDMCGSVCKLMYFRGFRPGFASATINNTRQDRFSCWFSNKETYADVKS